MRRHAGPNLTKYLYIAPIFCLIGMVFLYPLVRVIMASFYNIRLGALEGTFVGLDNYGLILSDPVFWRSVKTTLIWTLSSAAVQIVVPTLLAIYLNQKLKSIHFVMTSILLPWIVPMVGMAVAMRWMLLPGVGIFDEILQYLGTRVDFLGSPNAAMATLVIFNAWKWLPWGVLLTLAALQTISEELYEAARVDGANFWRMLIHITLPLLERMIWFIGFLVLVWNFNAFDVIWITTRGGPGQSMQTLSVLIYRRAFRTFRLGEGSTIAAICVVGLAITGILYFKYLSPKEET
jgi:ABC-type sugar transport system permease subunit